MRGFAIGACVSICWAASALVQTVTLTEKSGRPLTVGAFDFAWGLSPSGMTAEAVVEEFQRICLPDPLAASTRIEASPFGFLAGEAVFRETGKHGEVRIPRWQGDSANLTIWPASADLKGELITIDERAYQVRGSYGPFRAEGDQCNLVVQLRSFDDAKQVGEALASAYGPKGKLVVKNTFADGHWTDGDFRINFTTPSTKNESQPVHLSVQIVKKGPQP